MDQSTTTAIAPLPKWLAAKNQQSQTTASLSDSVSQPEGTVKHLCSKCPFFKEAWEAQQIGDLSEPKWFNCISLLHQSGHLEAAKHFSRASHKHNEHSDARLASLIASSPKRANRCTTIGCDEQQIAKCFKGKIRRNKIGVINNSPGQFLRSHRRASLLLPSLPL
jgi:hypothetical protein